MGRGETERGGEREGGGGGMLDCLFVPFEPFWDDFKSKLFTFEFSFFFHFWCQVLRLQFLVF